jgi:IS4 transposase
MLLGPIFDRFVQRSPFAVMSRALLEQALCPRDLDALFEQHADQQYTRTLLFSAVVDLLSLVVTSTYSSVRAAYLDQVVDISVSLTSVYNKLAGIEDAVATQLVRHTVGRLQPVLAQLGGLLPEPIAGYRMRILDGNHLAATQHRLAETRDQSAAPLPGQSLVVYEPAWQMATDLILCQDGHAQERSLLGQVLDKVQAKDLWLADRNFCVKHFLCDLARRQAFFLVREHQQLNYRRVGKLRRRGRVETGEVFEQKILVEDDAGQTLCWRRVVLVLDQPTRDGDRELALITNLPAQVTARTIARTYRKRWTIETGFAELTETLCCEIDTLCYPRAALFVFCVALAAYNMQSAIKGIMRAVHGAEKIEQEFSRYFMAEEISRVHEGMLIALPAEEWLIFREMPVGEFAEFLRGLAAQVQLERYPKSHRGPKKPKQKRRHDPKCPHVSTASLLLARKAQNQRATK